MEEQKRLRSPILEIWRRLKEARRTYLPAGKKINFKKKKEEKEYQDSSS